MPSTIYRDTAGEHDLGSLVIRHKVTPELVQAGGHIRYHIVLSWRRRGHATRMLAAGLEQCRELEISRCHAAPSQGRQIGAVPHHEGSCDRFATGTGSVSPTTGHEQSRAVTPADLNQSAASPISARSCSATRRLTAPGETPMTRLKARLNAASDR